MLLFYLFNTNSTNINHELPYSIYMYLIKSLFYIYEYDSQYINSSAYECCGWLYNLSKHFGFKCIFLHDFIKFLIISQQFLYNQYLWQAFFER